VQDRQSGGEERPWCKLFIRTLFGKKNPKENLRKAGLKQVEGAVRKTG
jgi:hypothetical protein